MSVQPRDSRWVTTSLCPPKLLGDASQEYRTVAPLLTAPLEQCPYKETLDKESRV